MKKGGLSSRALVLIGVAASVVCATFITTPSEKSKRAEGSNPVACPPEWLPLFLACPRDHFGTCDEVWDVHKLNCAQLISFGWDCTGCTCPGDDPLPPPPAWGVSNRA